MPFLQPHMLGLYIQEGATAGVIAFICVCLCVHMHAHVCVSMEQEGNFGWLLCQTYVDAVQTSS